MYKYDCILIQPSYDTFQVNFSFPVLIFLPHNMGREDGPHSDFDEVLDPEEHIENV